VSLFQAIVLGLIQGITEFFPISSSSHERIVNFLLSSSILENDVLFDLACHMGTVLAALYFFRKEIWSILRSITKMSYYALALVPLAIIYFSMKKAILYLDKPHFMGFALIITALLLFYVSFKKIKEKEKFSIKDNIKDVLLIGIMQTMALIPGLSRSGFTISAALLRGWNIKKAITFSFILSIPTIMGGSFLEVLHISSLPKTPMIIYLAAFLSSFIAGMICVHFVFKAITQKNMRYFACYCLFLAILSMILFR